MNEIRRGFDARGGINGKHLLSKVAELLSAAVTGCFLYWLTNEGEKLDCTKIVQCHRHAMVSVHASLHGLSSSRTSATLADGLDNRRFQK